MFLFGFHGFWILGCVFNFEIVFSNLMGLVSGIQREEKSVQKAIRDAAKRNDMGYTLPTTLHSIPFLNFQFLFPLST